MRNYLIGFTLASVLTSLVGCQSNPQNATPGFFNMPFSSATSVQTPANLTQAVQEALMRSDELAVSPIQVDSNQNTVILRGYVKKIRQSDIAEQIARQVPGVQTVQNDLVVRP